MSEGGAKTTLTLPYPPPVNRCWRIVRGRGLVPTGAVIRYKRDVALLAKACKTRLLKGELLVEVDVHRPRKVGDLDNVLKVLFDACNGVVWLDDSQVVVIKAALMEEVKGGAVALKAYGEGYCTAAEVRAHREAKAATVQKRKATTAFNRRAKWQARGPA